MSIYKLNLKTAVNGSKTRDDLIHECLEEKKFLAIGWSYLYNDASVNNYYNISIPNGIAEYKQAILEENNQRCPRSVSTFLTVQKNDLIWTRDLNGIYYLCRALDTPTTYCDKELDIGCVINAEILPIGSNAPGKVIRSFSVPGTIQHMHNDSIEEYSQALYNKITATSLYQLGTKCFNFFDLISPMDLEELVLIYLQIEKNYYLSKNSIANNSTTIKIEAELFSRTSQESAVVQVKSGKAWTDPKSFIDYVSLYRKKVYLFFENENYTQLPTGVIGIAKDELIKFVQTKKMILPPMIRDIANICKL